LCNLAGQWSVGQGSHRLEAILIWISIDDGICDGPSGDTTCSCKSSHVSRRLELTLSVQSLEFTKN
jgi:hypothetical protein